MWFRTLALILPVIMRCENSNERQVFSFDYFQQLSEKQNKQISIAINKSTIKW